MTKTLTVKKKKQYRVTNWREYNASLKQRGSLTVWFSEEVQAAWNATSSTSLKRGRQLYYSDLAITTCLILRTVFKQSLRQTQGLIHSIFDLMNFHLDVPDYTRLSRRGTVSKLNCRLEKLKEPGHLVVDSTGIKVFGESEWLENKHGKQYKRKIWRKLHIGIDQNGLIVSNIVTEHTTDDRACLPDHLQQADSAMVTELIADSGYDGQKTYDQLDALKIKTLIPPAGKLSGKEKMQSSRQNMLRYIHKKGIYAWKNKFKYGRRNLVENTFFRFKEIIGRKFRARNWLNQCAEATLACFVLNQFNKFGMPIALKS